MREVLGERVPDFADDLPGDAATASPKASASRRNGARSRRTRKRAPIASIREEIGTDAYVEMLDTPRADDNMVSASFTGAGGTVRATSGSKARSAIVFARC